MTDRMLQRVLQAGRLLLRSERLDEAWPHLVPLVEGSAPLRGAVLVTPREPDQPLAWWREEASPSERRRTLARARGRLGQVGSDPVPRHGREEPRSFSCPLVNERGEVLGVLQLEWSGTPGEQDLAFASALSDQLAAALDGRARREDARAWHIGASVDLLATVSHEMKNLLSVLNCNLSLLHPAHDGEPSGPVDRMRRAIDRMCRLADDLLDSACLETGHLSVEPRRLEVGPLVSEALEAAAPLAAERSVQLQGKVPPSPPSIWGDGTRLQQVFTNLVGNALKFSPPHGTITIRAEPTGGEVRFSVANDGPGIPPEDLPHLFDRFWQAKPTAKLGVGLGLYIVKGIVQAHGGRVWVENRGRAGATFFFTVPVAEPAHPHAPTFSAGSGR